MLRVKLVLSDLHIGMGATDPEGRRNEYEDFVQDERLIEFLEYYRTAEYLDAEVEVVLNGDVLEQLQPCEGEERPDHVTERTAVERTKRIVAGHPALFDALAQFARQPSKRISIVIGNHDPAYVWEGVQKVLRDRISSDLVFHTDPYRFDGVHIEHGHQHEAANRVEPDQIFLTRRLNEPILYLPWGTQFVIFFLNRLKHRYPYVDKVRPFRRFLRWCLFYDFWLLMKMGFFLMIFFFRGFFRRHPQMRTHFRQMIRILREAAVFPTLDRAAEEILARDASIHTVVFGHTHGAKVRQFAPGKDYVNTGTWNTLTSLEVGSLGTRTRLTYAKIVLGVGQPRTELRVWFGRGRVNELFDAAA
ncbi:MAG: hypothetical protein HYY84_18135 [Deltaproteobacteria bacterium]|nr:hypothetical protein [Deltaproteobacteria bacterium]